MLYLILVILRLFNMNFSIVNNAFFIKKMHVFYLRKQIKSIFYLWAMFAKRNMSQLVGRSNFSRARCLSWIRFHHSANVPFYFIILKISQESEKSIKINRELMNGLGYGRFNGLSGSRNSLREFSNNYYGRRKSDYYQLMTNVDRNTRLY